MSPIFHTALLYFSDPPPVMRSMGEQQTDPEQISDALNAYKKQLDAVKADFELLVV